MGLGKESTMAATGIFGAADAARVLLTQQSAELAEPDRDS